MTTSTSLIMTTYNWPEALGAVLDTAANQLELPDEVLVADDGSGVETRNLIKRYQKKFPCPLIHVWHEDKGRRAAKIRNKAAVRASSDYLVFIDADCLLRPNFIAQHTRLSKPGFYVAGNRVLLSEESTGGAIKNAVVISSTPPLKLSEYQLNRRFSLFQLPLGLLRNLYPNSWKGVKSCNMSLFVKDYIAANGFEEEFEGWGYEDSDLAVRLHRSGVKRISGRFAVTVIHLWHKSSIRDKEKSNWNRFQETANSMRIRSLKGVDQYY